MENGDLMGFQWWFNGIPGLVNIQKTIEHGPVEIVSFPMTNGDVPQLQCEAPKISKLVYNSNNYMVYGTQITIVTGANLNQLTSLGGLTSYFRVPSGKLT